MDRSLLEKKALAELRQIASTLDLRGYQRMKKADLVDMIVGAGAADGTDSSSGNGSPSDETSQDASNSRASGDGDAGSDDGPARERARARQRDEDDRDDRGGDDGGDGDEDDDDRGGRNRNKQRRRKNRGGGNQPDLEDAEVREGVLDLLPEGYGFLRTTGYLSGSKDVYVSQSFVRRFSLRRGDRVRGPIRSNNRGNDKFPALARVDTIEGLTVDEHMDDRRADFRELTSVFPHERLRLETDAAPAAMRLIDVLAPIGKGQRGLIVSPPRAGKTTILKQLAHGIEANHPDVHVMVLLVDERPEEVTDFERATSGEVISSTFDRPAEDHTQVAELCLERAKRLVERGRDVVVLMDSITRLTRAYNLASPASGRTLAGGLDSGALYPPKRFFGAARNTEDGGSLTIIATALIETGSAMDDVIFEEFAGTANMELRLDQGLQRQRLFPAIDVQQSASRHEELLLDDDRLDTIRRLRRSLAQTDTTGAIELLTEHLAANATNDEFLDAFEKDGLETS